MGPDEARQVMLEPLFAARGLLSVIEGAESTGVMTLLVQGPATIREIAQCGGLDADLAESFVATLVAGDVIKRQGEHYALTEVWNAAFEPGGFTPLSATLTGERVTAEQLRTLGADHSYWSLASSDRVALAAAVSPGPMEGSFVDIVKMMAKGGHPYALAGSRAKRRLELGCGLAGAALSELVAFPGIRQVVGVELSEDLAAEADRRAQALGVADRFTVVRCDAADFVDPELFDVGFWSQYFFADGSRAGALDTLFRQVRSGGMVAAPVAWFDSESSPKGSVSAQRYAQDRLLAQSWGVPERSPQQLEDELGSVGFVDIQTVPTGPTELLVVAIRP